MTTFNKNYFYLTILIFVIEILIALFMHDKIIRPYFGDVLVVILIYCFIKSFIKLSVLWAAIFVLCFAFTIEILQYFKVIKIIGLGNSKIANMLMGNSFSWIDILTYIAGILVVLFAEKYSSKNDK